MLFRWLCWSCSARLRLFVVACLCWWLGGNCYHRRCVAACRRRVGGLWSQNPPRGCSYGPASRARGGVYGRKTPRVLAQSAVDLGGMGVTWGFWGVVDYGLGALVRREAFLWCGVSGTSGLSACCRDDRAHCRRFLRGGAGGRRILVRVGDVLLCCGRGGAAAYGQVFLRRDRLGIVCSCARVLVGTIDCTVGAGVPKQPFPKRRKWSSRRHTRRAVSLGSRVHALWWCRSLVRPSTSASDEYFKN